MIFLLRRHPFNARVQVAGLLGSLSIWCLAYAGELASASEAQMMTWLRLQYLGLSFLPAWAFLFSLSFGGILERTPKSISLTAFLPGLVTLLQVWRYPSWTGFYRDLVVGSLDSVSFLRVIPGPWYWIHVTMFYLSVLLFFCLMLRTLWQKGGLYRKQLRTFALASLFPLVGNVAYLTGWLPLSGFDPTCVLLSFYAVGLVAGVKQYRLFDVVPYARDLLVERLQDGVLVTDASGRVVDINPVCRDMLRCFGDPLGCMMEEILPEELRGRDTDTQHPLSFQSLGADHSGWLEMRSFPLQRNQVPAGRLFLFRDVDQAKTLQEEREKLIQELEEALANVNQLKGLIPICANCKKIRDDQGYWNHLETFLQSHSEMTFSHGICPDCLKKHYRFPPRPGEAPESS